MLFADLIRGPKEISSIIFCGNDYVLTENLMDRIIDNCARVLVALAGGLSLIIPLVMLTFLTSVAARLSIVCCCVADFLSIAWRVH